jgi:hypothetical protein
MSLALLLLPARSADRKKSLLPFGRRGGLESGLLNAQANSTLAVWISVKNARRSVLADTDRGSGGRL